MRLMQQWKDGPWIFAGDSLPMELARKTWPDRYAAVRAAMSAGFSCYANGDVREDEPTAQPIPCDRDGDGFSPAD